jgi:hypothetical protein
LDSGTGARKAVVDFLKEHVIGTVLRDGEKIYCGIAKADGLQRERSPFADSGYRPEAIRSSIIGDPLP